MAGLRAGGVGFVSAAAARPLSLYRGISLFRNEAVNIDIRPKTYTENGLTMVYVPK